MSFVIIIPTYNGEATLERLLKSINIQSVSPDKIYIIDSSSTDNTINICKKYNCEIKIIEKSAFNHGLTRQMGIDNNKNYDYAVFMTQDIILKNNNTLETLLSSFNIENVSIAYGRQIVEDNNLEILRLSFSNDNISVASKQVVARNSSFIEKVNRTFNYPDRSIIKSRDDIKKYGISTAFCSDSFSAYKISDLLSVGGFPKTCFGEDMLVASKIILSGKSVYYNSQAEVVHSHPYSIKDEYRRGKAIKKMHKENKWLIDTFGKAENKGKELLKTLPFHKKILYIIEALPKLIGYKLG